MRRIESQQWTCVPDTPSDHRTRGNVLLHTEGNDYVHKVITWHHVTRKALARHRNVEKPNVFMCGNYSLQ